MEVDILTEFLLARIDYRLVNFVTQKILKTKFETKSDIFAASKSSAETIYGSFKCIADPNFIFPRFEESKIYCYDHEAENRFFGVHIISVQERDFSASILMTTERGDVINAPLCSYRSSRRFGMPYNFLLIHEIESFQVEFELERRVELINSRINTHFQIKQKITS